ncbi:MAG TPA: DHHA1 domain-containing protein, partial [Candidatus Sulfomarinibacteraceae bacterium]|nr:DHHA1 domain-containing protein [Candidatus Sulfomarinibacteraceae bacterium]
AYLRSRAEALEVAMSAVGAQTGEAVAARIGALQDELREARRRLKAGAGAGTGGGIPKPAEIAARAVQIAPGVRLAALAAPFDSMDELRRVARDVSGALGSGIVALGLDADEPQVFVTVSADLVARGISAGDLVRAAMAAIDGRGGGRPEMAQGRGARREGLGDALAVLEAAAREIASGEATAGEAAR